MKVDGGVGWELDKVGAQAQELEEMGYAGILSAETSHDPFLPLLVAAQNTENNHEPNQRHDSRGCQTRTITQCHDAIQ